MSKIGAWILASRPRTLPLSISGILVGTALAEFYSGTNTWVFVFALLTTVGFQITSNFANDYGDGVKGTDNANRIGPKRALQSGLLTKEALKKGIFISILVNLLLVLLLLFFAFGTKNWYLSLFFMVLGVFSIWAAIKYTVGKSAYGYRGLGDVFVFIFFGLLSVLGSMFLHMKYVALLSILPAISIGLLSVGVLNLNNLRDFKSDKQSGKNTLIVKMGFENGKKYHYLLLFVSFMAMLCFMFFSGSGWLRFMGLIAYVPIFVHMGKVKNCTDPKLLDPELKKLALSTFFIAFLFYLSYYIFL